MKEYWLRQLRTQLYMVEAKIMTLKVEKEKAKGEYDNAKGEVSTQEEILEELKEEKQAWFDVEDSKIENRTYLIAFILSGIFAFLIYKFQITPYIFHNTGFISKASFNLLVGFIELVGAVSATVFGTCMGLGSLLRKRANKKIENNKVYQNLLKKISSQEKSLELAKSNRDIKQNRFNEVKTKYDKARTYKFKISGAIDLIEKPEEFDDIIEKIEGQDVTINMFDCMDKQDETLNLINGFGGCDENRGTTSHLTRKLTNK